MHVEQYGYWRDIEFEALNCLNDSQLVMALFKVDRDEGLLNRLIYQSVFDVPPADRITLIDAANIVSHSMFDPGEVGIPIFSENEDWRIGIIDVAASSIVHDVLHVLDESIAAFKKSGEDNYRMFIANEYKPTPCKDGVEGRHEMLSLIHIWLSHLKTAISLDSSFSAATFGNVNVPAIYGMGYCSPGIKAFACFDRYARKKLPSLVGMNHEALSEKLQNLSADANLS